jgi:hypothetical protein
MSKRRHVLLRMLEYGQVSVDVYHLPLAAANHAVDRGLPALRFRPRRVDHHLPPNASKMGGVFLWPADEPWPFCREGDPVAGTSYPTRDEFLEKVRAVKLAEQMPFDPLDLNDAEANGACLTML